MSIQKKFNAVGIVPTVIAAGQSHYFDLGLLKPTGSAVGHLFMTGTQAAIWEFRYNSAGQSAGDDSHTVAWNKPSPITMMAAANAPNEVNFTNNGVVAPLNLCGDKTQHIWLKITNSSGSSGSFGGMVGLAESGYISYAG